MNYAIELTRTKTGKFYANVYSIDSGIIEEEMVSKEYDKLEDLLAVCKEFCPDAKINDFHVEK